MEYACRRVGGRVHSGKRKTPGGKALITDMMHEAARMRTTSGRISGSKNEFQSRPKVWNDLLVREGQHRASGLPQTHSHWLALWMN